MSAEIVIATLAKTLSGSLVKPAGRRIRKEFEDPERSRALERACQAGNRRDPDREPHEPSLSSRARYSVGRMRWS